MDIATKIKTLVKEAEIYRGHGLLSEALQKYEGAAKTIRSIEHIKNRDSILSGLSKKIQALKQDIDRVENAPMTPEMDKKSQKLIKKLFSFARSEQKDEAVALEEAITLTKFGQYDRALVEFRSLIDKEEVRLAAAKNTIRCHLARGTEDKGIEEFRQWSTDSRFTPDQLEKLRAFFSHILKKKGLDKPLPEFGNSAKNDEPVVEPVKVKAEKKEAAEEEILDINAVAITFGSGAQQGETMEFDVSFQNGNIISILISGKQKELADLLNTGDTLTDIQFFSPIAIFPGNGKVAAKTQIKVGPRKGDYSVDIKVSSN
ncbi:MAG: hypothetical protein JEZ11_12075 [Desulfobacterales bacterium]|nr:hypothetical protein [Desulfobacterales bacterium]